MDVGTGGGSRVEGGRSQECWTWDREGAPGALERWAPCLGSAADGCGCEDGRVRGRSQGAWAAKQQPRQQTCSPERRRCLWVKARVWEGVGWAAWAFKKLGSEDARGRC